MTAAAHRTPVSILFDLCNQNNWKSEYDLITVEGASHDPIFTYKVKVEDVEATASGHSKKKAKHSAAKSALEQLLSKPDFDKKNFLFEGVTVTLETLNDIIIEPVSEPVPAGVDTKNSVGILAEYCTKNKLMAPYYETINESGPPHDKVFSVQLSIGRLTTDGEGKTKRIAKRQAAEAMLKILKELEDMGEKFDDEKSSTSIDETEDKDEQNCSSLLVMSSSSPKKLVEDSHCDVSDSTSELNCQILEMSIPEKVNGVSI